MVAHTFYVYIFEDPATQTPRYVGKGKGKDRRWLDRFKAHITNARLNSLIKRSTAAGHLCAPVIIECPSENSALALEIFWIAVYGRYNASTETRKQISTALTGEKHPAFGKRGTECPNFGRKYTAERCAEIAMSLKGRIQPRDVVDKRAASNRGKKRTPEQLANLRAGQDRYRARQQTEMQ